ncbi:hypothetical protein GCM10020255_013440 [Rhodococcus baikonurensis]
MGQGQEYATATGANRPAYLDNPTSVIPPTFLATVVYWEAIGNTLRSPEVAEACATAGIPSDITNLMSLEQEYVFHGPPPQAGIPCARPNDCTMFESSTVVAVPW